MPLCKMTDLSGFKHLNAALHIIGSGFQPNGSQIAHRCTRGAQDATRRGNKGGENASLSLFSVTLHCEPSMRLALLASSSFSLLRRSAGADKENM